VRPVVTALVLNLDQKGIRTMKMFSVLDPLKEAHEVALEMARATGGSMFFVESINDDKVVIRDEFSEMLTTFCRKPDTRTIFEKADESFKALVKDTSFEAVLVAALEHAKGQAVAAGIGFVESQPHSQIEQMYEDDEQQWKNISILLDNARQEIPVRPIGEESEKPTAEDMVEEDERETDGNEEEKGLEVPSGG